MAKRIEVPCDDGVVEATFDTYKGGWKIGFPFGDRRFFGNERELRAFVAKELAEHDSCNKCGADLNNPSSAGAEDGTCGECLDGVRYASEAEPVEWIIQRGPETVEDGQCTLCGRDYSDEPRIRRCQSDDCPSHWEEVGLKREG